VSHKDFRIFVVFLHFSVCVRVRACVCVCTMQEMMRIHETVFWVDASIRMHSSNLDKLYQQTISTGGILMLLGSTTNIWMMTYYKMYSYLPIDKAAAINVTMYGTGAMFFRRSNQVGRGHIILFSHVSMQYVQSTILFYQFCMYICMSNAGTMSQETQLSLTNRATHFEVSQGHQTSYHSIC